MKTILLVLVFFSSSFCLCQEVERQFEEANQLYRIGEYEKAATAYEQILKNGYETASLYYNLGNAYFKANNLPAAILNYERAHRIAPSDDDISYNLRLSNLRVADKIEPVPKLFFVEWWQALTNAYSSDIWAMILVGCLWLVLATVCSVVVAHSQTLRRILSTLALLGITVFILSTIGTVQRSRIESAENVAILFQASSYVKSSPDDRSTDLFVLHEGVKVEILDTVESWKKIRLVDGKVGWIPSSALRII